MEGLESFPEIDNMECLTRIGIDDHESKCAQYCLVCAILPSVIDVGVLDCEVRKCVSAVAGYHRSNVFNATEKIKGVGAAVVVRGGIGPSCISCDVGPFEGNIVVCRGAANRVPT